jgi:hypothetical protein
VSREENNKTIVGRWFTEFLGATCNLNIVDELAAPDMLLQYSLHEPPWGREDIKAFMSDFRQAFPDFNFWGAADLIAEGDYVVRSLGRWRHAHRPGLQRLPGRISSGRNRTEDALHRNHGVANPGMGRSLKKSAWMTV